ncbi:hypothetical protein [Sphingorhabdus sp. Alg239-R122]|uniref:hypothetical protein n=1 Tax=Sphingorhabdus sp. Alg239-R122 TaxID=2305989 RepID=UPI0013D9976E|nr:hypothetical protein [Sphingorhabdus sp. Alg239-R122]
MLDFLDSLDLWGAIAIGGAVVALVASLAERRRNNRADVDRVGFMPWTLILVLAVLTTIFAASFALKSG